LKRLSNTSQLLPEQKWKQFEKLCSAWHMSQNRQVLYVQMQQRTESQNRRALVRTLKNQFTTILQAL
jgi:hypothetical protein